MISEEAELTEDSDHHGDTETRSRVVPVGLAFRPVTRAKRVTGTARPFCILSPRLRVSVVCRFFRTLR